MVWWLYRREYWDRIRLSKVPYLTFLKIHHRNSLKEASILSRYLLWNSLKGNGCLKMILFGHWKRWILCTSKTSVIVASGREFREDNVFSRICLSVLWELGHVTHCGPVQACSLGDETTSPWPCHPLDLFKRVRLLPTHPLVSDRAVSLQLRAFLLHWTFIHFFRFRRMPRYASKVVQKYQAWRQLCRKVQCIWWYVLWCSVLAGEIYQAEK